MTRCTYCGRILTDEASMARGIGPDCQRQVASGSTTPRYMAHILASQGNLVAQSAVERMAAGRPMARVQKAYIERKYNESKSRDADDESRNDHVERPTPPSDGVGQPSFSNARHGAHWEESSGRWHVCGEPPRHEGNCVCEHCGHDAGRRIHVVQEVDA